MSNINNRIERLPITSEHKFAVIVMAMAYFFELDDQSSFPYAATGLIVHWHIAVSVVALITSATFGGMLLGAILGGHAAGTLGRKKAFMLAILIFSGGSLLDGLSWNIYSLAIFKFATGFGMTALTIVANTYVTEIIPARVRGKYMAVVMTIGFVGIPVTALVAQLIVPLFPWGWRGVFIWGGLGIIMLPFVFRLPESPRWLVTMGREREAEDIVKKFEKTAINEFGTLATAVASEFTEHDNDEGGGQYKQLFSKKYRSRTIVLLITWTFVSMGFYGFYAWVPTLLVKHGFSVVKSLDYSSLMAICNPVGAALAILFIEKFERKFFFGACAAFVAGSVIFYGSSFQPTLIVIFGALAILGMQAGMVALYAYTPEIFPTKIRSHGMALTFSGGRISNIIGAFVISSLYGFGGYYSVFLFVSICWLVGGGLVAVLGPYVTGRALEEISEFDPDSQQLLPASPSSGRQPG